MPQRYLKPHSLRPAAAPGARRPWRRLAAFLCALVAASALVFVGTPLAATGPAVTRGPYLQRLTPDSVVMRWRTDEVTDSVVDFGTEAGDLDRVAGSATLTDEHVVELTGLAAATRYYYAVGDSAGRLAGDASYSFVTAPTMGSRDPFRVWVLGDSGTGNADARRVRDAFEAWAGPRDADLWLMLGDNAYTHGTDEEYQNAVFDTYRRQLRRLPLWPTLGNHDGGSANSATGSGVYYDVFTLPAGGEAGGVASGTEAYYSFDYGNAHFVCLESHSLDRTPAGAMLTWLERDLAATTAEWIVAYWHHPPYSKGSHDSDAETALVEMRRHVVPVLESHGVDLVLAGHSHGYERSYLLDGHYGSSFSLSAGHLVDAGDGRPDGDGAYVKRSGGHSGAVYVVAGSAARVGRGSLDHPAMVVSLARLGSLVLDVAGSRLDVVFVDAVGAELDRFRLLKPSPQLALDLPARPRLSLDSPASR